VFCHAPKREAFAMQKSHQFLKAMFALFLFFLLPTCASGPRAVNGGLLFSESGVVVPGDNLELKEIPPIPLALSKQVMEYTESRSALISSWHPTRREMLITTRLKDVSQVYKVASPGGTREEMTSFSEPATEAIFEPQRGEYFVFQMDKGGNENYQFYRFDAVSKEITLLTDGSSRHTSRVTSRHSGSIAYAKIKRTPAGATTEIHIMDPATPSSDKKIAELAGGGFMPLDWSPDDTLLLVEEFVSQNESYLWLFDTKSGAQTLITPKGGPDKIFYSGAEFDHGGKTIFTATDHGSEFQRLARIDLDSGIHTYFTTEIPWDVEYYAGSPDGKVMAFVTNEDGISVLHLLDLKNHKRKRVPQLGNGVMLGLTWRPDSSEVGLSMTAAKLPTDVFSVNIETLAVTRWTRSEAGGIDLDRVSEPELIHWTANDGLKISGFYYMPSTQFSGPRPVIVSIHGGPEAQARPSFLGRANYFIDELGAAVILPNIRGSTGYGKTFLARDNGLLREAAYADIEALLSWIASRPELDKDRVMIMGGSYGGHVTLVAASRYANKIRCALDVVGMSNLRTFLENTESYRRDLRRAEYGDEREPTIRAWMEKTAPVNNARAITKPLFVVQGANDPRVPKTEAMQISETVRTLGVPSWFLMANDEGHGFSKKKNQDFQMFAMVMFVNKFLIN
jgi:dipeptidyl aminopeptidase/acylaminoacyl peptidase